MMKNAKLFVILCLLLAVASTATAQVKERGLFVEMNAGLGRTKSWGKDDGGYALLAPAAGYQFNRNWAAGVRAKFSTGYNKEVNTYSAYAQCAFLVKRNWKVFVEGSASLCTDEDKFVNVDGALLDENGFLHISPSKNKEHYKEFGFSLGASYALRRHLNVVVRCLHIGYSDCKYSDWDAVLGGGDWIVDANLRRLSLGLQYIF